MCNLCNASVYGRDGRGPTRINDSVRPVVDQANHAIYKVRVLTTKFEINFEPTLLENSYVV